MFIFALIFSYFARIVVFIIRLLGAGSGTTLTGYWIEKYCPQMVAILTRGADRIILVTGTNGKTTTRSILVKIFEDQGVDVCTNRGGANIYRGIGATLLFNWNWLGRLKKKTLILEVEEATLPKLTKYIKPDYLVLTNIFRDQMDAYGEIDNTLEYFRISINQTNAQLIINADDHKLLSVLAGVATIHNPDKVKFLNGQTHNCNDTKKVIVRGFGISDKTVKMLDFEDYSTTYKIDWTSLTTAYSIKNEHLQSKLAINNCNYKSSVKPSVDYPELIDDNFEVSSPLIGTYNTYNVLASLSLTIPIFGNKALDSISTLQPVFGRGEKIIYRNKEIWLFLVKNPAGMNQVLELIEDNFGNELLHLSFLVNDKIADGKDVSWLWDCGFEEFVSQSNSVNQYQFYTSGSRGLDMLLRLETAGADVALENNYGAIEDHLDKLIYRLNTQPQKHIVLATYTAMMEFRRLLSKRVALPKISDEGN